MRGVRFGRGAAAFGLPARCPSGLGPRCRFVAPDPAIAIGQDLSLALAAFAFEGPIRRTLARLKYEGASRLAGPLAKAATPTLQPPPGDHRRRATGSGPRTPGAAPGARLQPGRAPRASDGFRGRASRHRSPRARAPDDEATSAGPSSATREPAGGVLDASGAHRPMPAAVIVVDDIVTTTATLEACASVLRSAGVARGLPVRGRQGDLGGRRRAQLVPRPGTAACRGSRRQLEAFARPGGPPDDPPGLQVGHDLRDSSIPARRKPRRWRNA